MSTARFRQLCTPGYLASLPVAMYRRALSPALPARCRFYPSCSAYTLTALRERGIVVGLALSTWRLLRCQPFHPGGYDPVPERAARSARSADVPMHRHARSH